MTSRLSSCCALALSVFCGLLPAQAAGVEERLLLPDGTLVVADAERFRLFDAARAPARLGGAVAVDRLAPGHDLKRTQQLLSGAFIAAWMRRRPADAAAPGTGDYTLARYIYSLASSYVTTLATPQVMRRLATRLRAQGQPAWAKFCDAVAANESGHEDELVRDLNALGIDAEAFLKAVRPPAAVALVEHFNRLVDGDPPVAAIGYVYALQRSSLLLDAKITARIEALIPAGVNASRSLRTHGGTGGNARHVEETEKFVATLPADARRAVVLAMYRTIDMMLGPDDFPGDAAAERTIGGFRAVRQPARP